METLTNSAATAEAPSSIVAALMRERWSCRGFLSQRVPHETIMEMLAMAQQTASWCNSQPWQAIVTEGDATAQFRDALYAYASGEGWAGQASRPELPDFPFPARYAGAYDVRRRETGWALYASVGIARGDRAASGRQMLENFRLFGAPHVAIITTERDLGIYGAVDCGGYVANLMLAARSLGVSTVAQAALAGVSGVVRRYFEIPEHRMILCGVSFGYADPDHPANGFRTVRVPLEDVVRFVE